MNFSGSAASSKRNPSAVVVLLPSQSQASVPSQSPPPASDAKLPDGTPNHPFYVIVDPKSDTAPTLAASGDSVNPYYLFTVDDPKTEGQPNGTTSHPYYVKCVENTPSVPDGVRWISDDEVEIFEHRSGITVQVQSPDGTADKPFVYKLVEKDPDTPAKAWAWAQGFCIAALISIVGDIIYLFLFADYILASSTATSTQLSQASTADVPIHKVLLESPMTYSIMSLDLIAFVLVIFDIASTYNWGNEPPKKPSASRTFLAAFFTILTLGTLAIRIAVSSSGVASTIGIVALVPTALNGVFTSIGISYPKS